jgi:hypothetical protein
MTAIARRSCAVRQCWRVSADDGIAEAHELMPGSRAVPAGACEPPVSAGAFQRQLAAALRPTCGTLPRPLGHRRRQHPRIGEASRLIKAQLGDPKRTRRPSGNPPARHPRPIGGGASAADEAIDPERCEYRTVEQAYWRNSRQPQSRRYVISRKGAAAREPLSTKR